MQQTPSNRTQLHTIQSFKWKNNQYTYSVRFLAYTAQLLCIGEWKCHTCAPYLRSLFSIFPFSLFFFFFFLLLHFFFLFVFNISHPYVNILAPGQPFVQFSPTIDDGLCCTWFVQSLRVLLCVLSVKFLFICTPFYIIAPQSVGSLCFCWHFFSISYWTSRTD